MEKYGNMVAFTNISEIEKWEQEQKAYVGEYLNVNPAGKIRIFNNITCIAKNLLTKWKNNPSRYLLVDEDELNNYLSLASRYMTEMYRFAKSKNISKKEAEKSIQVAFLEMNKFTKEDLKKMYLMCNENIEIMRRLMMFLSYECIDEYTIAENLSNETPVPFIVDNNSNIFLSIPCDSELKRNSSDYGYRYELSFSSEGKEKNDWMNYCMQQRESFEIRYDNFINSQKKCRL